ncbi:CopY family transcriptional regulator [Streptomyces pluripotens]|uniref:CopY family transcriptional regulator n=1 Tax=Streptomyces pluripotens TaxID=1355015 RepID=A0A221P0N3_9ACTN|nr:MULTISPECIES: BlaI/MecI/CopY family transcriptional regulator [Streptomyces]ARP71530.1 CopY family transcriptional regulator [Streptomyces pluripotens]ASN25781.1 CopY family transcriptional regulator [Streptomyces pluripotens]MCH0557448.1 BlaI/MecI/CopY family transcriptional regulator [Streptomyces sp. MUM 16J]
MSDPTDENVPGGSGRRARGELESDVLAALWAADGPLTARQVLDRLSGDLAYTTVLTILSRLYEKGMLVRNREGRGYAYTPVRDEASHTARRMRSLLEEGTDREAVLTRFVSELSAQEEQLLQQLLSRHEARDERSDRRQ